MMKRFLIFLVLCLLLLSSCSTSKGDGKQYRNDAAIADLTVSVEAALPQDVGYKGVAKGYLDDYLTIPDYVTDYVIRIAVDGNNINEYGIFQVRDGNADALSSLLKGYLKTSYEQNRDYYNSYNAGETPKLRDAEVRVFGNYVAYAIFSKADRATVFDTLGALLEQPK